MEGRKQQFRTVGEGEGARRKAKRLAQHLSEMEMVAASPEDRFLSWHRSGEPLPLDRAIRDHARAAKHTVAASTAERYGQFAELVVARPGDIDLRHLQKEDIGKLVRAECADDRAKDPTINACVLLRGTVLVALRTKDPALDQLMDCARRREITALVVVKLDRLARSTRHLSNLSHELKELGVNLVVLDQAIDTGTPAGELLFTMLGAISQFERALIVERTKAGVAAARRRGRHPGRPRALSNSQIARARRLRDNGKTVREIASIMDCATATIHRAVREASK